MAQKKTTFYNISDSARQTAGSSGRSTGNTSGSRAYIEGSAVRRLSPEPERIPEEKPRRQLTPQEEREKRLRESAARRNRRSARRMTLGHTVFLSCAALICALFVGTYVYLQSEITTSMNSISALQQELTDLKASNDAAETRIESSVSLDAVKAAAIDELGMQYADEDQIYTYSTDNSDYMNQYSSIGD